MNKFLVSLIILVFLLVSCEYQYTYRYVINNELDKTFDSDLTTSDKIISQKQISAKASVEIFSIYGGVSGKNYEPGDRREIKWDLDSLFIKTSDTTLSKNLADKSLWKFESKRLEGIYSLNLTEDILK